MSSPPGPADPPRPQGPSPAVRIGDRERLAVQDLLRDAFAQGALDTEEFEERLERALRARTAADLDHLVADLPAPVATSPPARQPDRPARSPWRWVVAVPLVLTVLYGVDQLTGGIVPPDAVAVFGSRQVVADPAEDRVATLVLFGSVEVVVPDGVTARADVTPVFGGVNCQQDTCTATDDPSVPTVTVTGLAIFGSVEVTR